MASWKMVLGEQVGSWGCKGKIYQGSQSYDIEDPEVVQAAARVRFITILPGDADVEAWQMEQAAAAVAVETPEETTPEADFVAETGEVSPEDDPSGETTNEDETEDPAEGEGGGMNMRAQLEDALLNDNLSPEPETEEEAPAAPAAKPAKKPRKSRSKTPVS